MRRDTVVVTACVVATLGTGGALTRLGPWYEQLRKPSFQPPGWLFGPAWSAIGVLTGMAALSSWRASRTSRQRRRVVLLFAVNGVLNAAWSALFFTRRRPDWALAEVLPLWCSIASLILFLPRPAGVPRARSGETWKLLPYLVWVSFAVVLNTAVVRLNAPFGERPAR